ncbi:hypothetical protein RND81_13G159700 [Saponaria officinalis]|uniref:non-specific serine/threonine protein kinase n=1 Tax=Saponaria officinalis TaxID=3572 RepID=A0AAW1H207_SAPOF
MTNISAFSGKTEIVEIEEEVNPGEHITSNNFIKPEIRKEERDRRSLTSHAGSISSLEEDLNQLFEIFNRRTSSHGSTRQNQASTPKRNTPKRSSKFGESHSPGHGISERVNLKQALRGLCLSQASEMAAMKRSMKSPRSSEAGRILTMYRNVVVEDVKSDHSQDDSKGGMLEISLLPESTTSDSFSTNLKKLPEPTMMLNDGNLESNNSSNHLTKSEKQKYVHLLPSSSPNANNSVRQVAKSGTRENEKPAASIDYASQTFRAESSQTGKCASPTYSSRSDYVKSSLEIAGKLPAHKVLVAAAVQAGKRKSKVDMRHQDDNANSRRVSDDFHDKATEPNMSILAEDVKSSLSSVFSSQLQLKELLHNERHRPLRSSRASGGKASLDIAKKMAEQQEKGSMSPVMQNQETLAMANEEEHTPNRSPRRSNIGENILDHSKNSATPSKVDGKEAGPSSAKVEAKKLTIPFTGSPRGKNVSRSSRNMQHLVKPVVKTKSFVKKRSKKKTAADNNSKYEFNNDLYSSPNKLVCPNCQCVVTGTWEESNNGSSLSHTDSPVSSLESPVSRQESVTFYQDSPISPFDSLSGEVSSGNAISDVSTPGPSSNGLNKSENTLVENCSNSRSRERADFTQSSKDSPDELSSNTSISEETNLSRPSFCDRPHMSKDVRWEAVRYAKIQNGKLSLKNFSLLKKLGCGDIGTVYLTELIGTNCLFAIKVMDNEFLARRKKITRAQTEKDILRMLDHPFLPTLYCQFTSDNLSCLVMEYCPGGDLHVLRQRQPGRCFTEQAARFYVAEVLLALEYLHMLGVVYRDLKPENILVREDGHIMLSDFDLSLQCAVSPTLLVSSSTSEGLRKKSHNSGRCSDSRCAQPLCVESSCQVTCFTPRKLAKSRKMKPDVAAEMRPLLQLVAEPTSARSNSFVGTHEYLAPEIIKGEGHGSAVDWWTYGIFLYELLYGRTPFKGAGNEETLANVVLQRLKFPDTPLVSLQARELIAALLVKEPENRLGTERGATEIKQHPFFHGLNWALIRCTVPPELPDSRTCRTSNTVSVEKNDKYVEHNSETVCAEQLEFEVF